MIRRLLQTTIKRQAGLTLLIPLLAASCAEGYDSPDGFDVGVRNTQLVTPDSVSFIVNSAGTQATISWPLIMGAAGYEVSFLNVDDPDNPVVVDDYDKYIVDGCQFTVPVEEDSRYQFEMRVLGNTDLGNKDALEPSVYSFSTLVPSLATIPTGSDIYQYMLEHPLDSTTIDSEVAIELEARGEYTCSGLVDFMGQKITFRGDKIYRPTVTMTGDGAFATYSGLKIKYINFDFTGSASSSFIFMTPADTLPESILSERLGYTRNGDTIRGIYVVADPIYVAHCWLKDLPNAFLHDNNVPCAYWYLTIDDCIIQSKNTSSECFVSLQKKGRMIKYISFTNSTIYNTEDNKSAYFIRYSNSSNANPEKTFGNATNEHMRQDITFSHLTVSKWPSGQKFVNNISGNGKTTVNIDHCIFNKTYQVSRRIGLGTTNYKFNFVWGCDASELTNKDSSGAPFASEYDPGFESSGMETTSLDFSKDNAGVDFTPTDYVIVTNNGGDLRWITTSTTNE